MSYGIIAFVGGFILLIASVKVSEVWAVIVAITFMLVGMLVITFSEEKMKSRIKKLEEKLEEMRGNEQKDNRTT